MKQVRANIEVTDEEFQLVMSQYIKMREKSLPMNP